MLANPANKVGSTRFVIASVSVVRICKDENVISPFYHFPETGSSFPKRQGVACP
jgi:hypothetical protein